MSEALLPIMAGVLAAKQDLLSFMQAMGEEAVKQVFAEEVARLVGPKRKHQADWSGIAGAGQRWSLR